QNITVNINDEDIQNRLMREINDRNIKLNLKRKNIRYKRGDFVYLMNHSSDKVDPRWIGPFQVVRVSLSGNNIYIKKKNKIFRTSINNIRPFWREEDVASPDSATVKM
ncbi:hypothetical protein DMUE_4386, partial [Dictyocoela muelleri]